MVKKGFADKKFPEKSPAERRPAMGLPAPEEAAQLIRAFVAVKNPQIRKAILAFVENLA